MFGIDSAELLIIALVALVVIGPKDLPRVMRTVGHFVGRARGMARHFRTGLDTMIREAELEEMEKKWESENERIMREHPLPTQDRPDEAADSDWGKPSVEVKASPTPPAPPAPPAPRSKAPPIPGPAPATPPPGERP